MNGAMTAEILLFLGIAASEGDTIARLMDGLDTDAVGH